MGTFYKAKKKKIVLLTCELVVELAKSSLQKIASWDWKGRAVSNAC
jgi:hypothetical protein